MAVRIRNSCCPCDCWALSAVPWKLPRTLVGMAMSASACSMTWRACASEVPGSMLNEMVVASSPSWWLMDVGDARSTPRATALSGTLVGVPVLEQAFVLEPVGQLARPLLEVRHVVALERVLVGGVAGATAHAQVLHGVQKHPEAGDLVELRPQPRNDGRCAVRALLQRLEVHKHEPTPGPAATREAYDGVHRWVLAD